MNKDKVYLETMTVEIMLKNGYTLCIHNVYRPPIHEAYNKQAVQIIHEHIHKMHKNNCSAKGYIFAGDVNETGQLWADPSLYPKRKKYQNAVSAPCTELGYNSSAQDIITRPGAKPAESPYPIDILLVKGAISVITPNHTLPIETDSDHLALSTKLQVVSSASIAFSKEVSSCSIQVTEDRVPLYKRIVAQQPWHHIINDHLFNPDPFLAAFSIIETIRKIILGIARRAFITHRIRQRNGQAITGVKGLLVWENIRKIKSPDAVRAPPQLYALYNRAPLSGETPEEAAKNRYIVTSPKEIRRILAKTMIPSPLPDLTRKQVLTNFSPPS